MTVLEPVRAAGHHPLEHLLDLSTERTITSVLINLAHQLVSIRIVEYISLVPNDISRK